MTWMPPPVGAGISAKLAVRGMRLKAERDQAANGIAKVAEPSNL